MSSGHTNSHKLLTTSPALAILNTASLVTGMLAAV